MVDEYDDDDESVAMASRRSVLEECLRWYMTEYGVDQEEALEMALGRVRRRYAWLTLPALKLYFHSWTLVWTMIQGRPKRILEDVWDGETVFEVEYLVVVAVW